MLELENVEKELSDLNIVIEKIEKKMLNNGMLLEEIKRDKEELFKSIEALVLKEKKNTVNSLFKEVHKVINNIQ